MMKKGVVFAIFIVLLTVGLEAVSAVGDIAYIYKRQFKIDENIVNVFSDAGLTVDFINENSLPRNLSGYKLLFVGDENFRKKDKIPVHDIPSVISNYYHESFWGYTDAEGASQLAANHPLSVLKSGQSIQVYTQATEGIGGPALPYYFLDIENKAPSLQTVALTEPTSSGEDFGDVISKAGPGSPLYGGKTQNAKMCFFGIIKSDFWTPQARNLFEDCVEYAGSECSIDSDCGSPHFVDGPFCENGDVYRTQVTPTCEDGSLTAECTFPEEDVLIEECALGCENGVCLEPACDENSDCNDSNVSTEDICRNPGEIDAFCENLPIECFQNSDCGIDGFIDEPVCAANNRNITRLFESFTCHNPGTSNSFCDSQTEVRIIETCEDFCLNGECEEFACENNNNCNDFNPLTFDVCVNPSTPLAHCENNQINCASDSDCGFTGFIGEEYCSADGDIAKDFRNATCVNPGYQDSHCSVTISQVELQECDELCLDGECQNTECNNNDDCDDSNPLTLDECINPGTVISECRNTPINCNNNNDCGFTGFIGEEFCSGDNVFKDYQTATCLNPSEPDSYCEVEVEQNLINECDFACFDSTCIRCDENSDCNDENNDTIDLCYNPRQMDSYCDNVEQEEPEITCSSDSDCPADIQLTGQFCSINNIYQIFMTFSCVNPGQTFSYCETDIEQILMQQCADFCVAGQCVTIECFNDEDCNDGNYLTIDECENPGTPSSYCNNTPIECLFDSDCNDGSAGQLYCDDDDIYRDFEEGICLLPGMLNSECDFDIDSVFQEHCQYACTQGQCVRCDENSDCNDGNSLTNDICLLPDTLLSYCVNNFTGECTPGQTRQCGTNVGACEFGTETCQANAHWGSCIGAINPTAETCNSIDDDCDGQVDEGGVCPPVCTNECSVNGTTECVGPTGFRICGNFDSDSCFEWSLVNQCGFGYTCQAGACVPVPPPACTNDCSFVGQTECVGPTGFRICGYFDSDSCLDWSSANQCGFGYICQNGECIATP